jgi:hypothetical protein
MRFKKVLTYSVLIARLLVFVSAKLHPIDALKTRYWHLVHTENHF